MIKNQLFALFLKFILFYNIVGISNAQSNQGPNQNKDLAKILGKTDSIVNLSSNNKFINELRSFAQNDSILNSAITAYSLFGLEHRKISLKWNLNSTIVIFWTVILLVMCGIAFAGIQFYISMQLAKKPDSGKTEVSPTQIEASFQGIKVSSPVLGVIILIISMLFFYLYLKYVYPITEVF